MMRHTRPVVSFLLTLISAALTLAAFMFLIRTRAQTTPGRSEQAAYKLADGSYAVETVDQVIHDAKRHKDLRALMLFSGQGKNQNGLTESSWKNMTRPMMSMTGKYDNGASGQMTEWRKDPFTYSPPGDKYHVFIDDAFHMSFTGALAQPNPQLADRPMIARLVGRTDQKAVFDYVKIASIAFWDAYLKDEGKAKAYLKSNSLTGYSKDSVKLDRK